MTWIIVKFEDENTVEAVPKSWYNSESSKCSWPPRNTGRTKLCDYIKNKTKPDQKWETFPANILGIYDDYQTAQRKAEKARSTNDLTSQNEDTKQRKRLHRKKSTKNRKSPSDNSSSEYISTDEKSDDEPYAKFTNLTKTTTKLDKFRSNSHVKHRSTRSNSPASNAGDTTRGNATHSDKYQSTAQSVFSLPSGSTENFSAVNKEKEPRVEPTIGFLKEIMKEVIKINLKVDDLTTVIIDLAKANVKPVRIHQEIMKPPEIMAVFPVDEESLEKLESWLTQDDNKDILLAELIRIGGADLNDVVRKLMYKILTNKVGMLYSWEGAKKKKAFKKLAIASVIKDVVRNTEHTKNCSETDTINVIKSWLVRSTDRYNNEIKGLRNAENE